MGKLQGELASTSSVPESALAISAQYRLVGRASSGAGGAEEITSSANIFTFLGKASLIAGMDYLRSPGADIPSVAGVTDIGAATGEYVHITGTEAITGLGTVAAGTYREVKFTGACTLTHNGTSLILPGAANIVTAANDTAAFRSLGSGNWVCLWYKRAASAPLAFASDAQMLARTSSAVALTPANLAAIPCFLAYKAADQTGITDNTEVQAVFDTEVYDVGGYFATNAWTPTIAGKVRLFARVAITGANVSTAACYAVIKKNGNALAYSIPAKAMLTGSNTETVFCYIEDICAANDVYTLWVLDNVAASDVTLSAGAAITYFGGSFIL